MFAFINDKKNNHFMCLWLAQLISQFGDRLNQMALIGLIAERAPGSALGLAKLLSFTIFPVFIIGPIAGALVDRWDHRRTMFVCDICRGLLVLSIALSLIYRDSMLPIYGVVFLAFCFSRFYVPAKMAIIPDLVTKENLLMANSLMTTTGMIAFVLGCALGGFIVDRVGARGGFIGDAITFFASALLILSIKPKLLKIKFNAKRIIVAGGEILKIEKSLWREVREGVRYIVTHKEISFVMNMLFILLAAAGAVYVVIIVFIQETFGSVTKDLGVLAVLLGLGLFLGTLIYGRWGKNIPWYKTIFFCLILGGVMIMVFAAVVMRYPNLLVAGSLALILGMVIGPIFIAANTIVHFVSDEQMRGKVFSAMEIVIHFAFLVAMLVSSIISEHVPRSLILIAVGLIFAGVGMLGLLHHKEYALALKDPQMA